MKGGIGGTKVAEVALLVKEVKAMDCYDTPRSAMIQTCLASTRQFPCATTRWLGDDPSYVRESAISAEQ